MQAFLVVKNYDNEPIGVYKTLEEAKAKAQSRLGFYATAVPVEFISPLERKILKKGEAGITSKSPPA